MTYATKTDGHEIKWQGDGLYALEQQMGAYGPQLFWVKVAETREGIHNAITKATQTKMFFERDVYSWDDRHAKTKTK